MAKAEFRLETITCPPRIETLVSQSWRWIPG
jgi:hypothetical protein